MGDTAVVPLDVAVALLQSQRPGFLEEAQVTGPAGCLAVEVGGIKDGDYHRYVFQLSSTMAGAGEGTGIPAAVGTILMHWGHISGPGVLPPEAAVDPTSFLDLAFDLMRRLGVQAGGDSGALHVEHTGPDGVARQVSLGV